MAELVTAAMSSPALGSSWLETLMRPDPALNQAPTSSNPARGAPPLPVIEPASRRHGSVRQFLVQGTDCVQLASRLMDLKAHTALVAMHLSTEWRDGLFRQLDFLLDPENWEPVDELPSKESYATAVRLIIFLGQTRRPGLGLTHDGNIILSWTDGDNRLTVECQPGDAIKWVLSHRIGGQKESAAGLSTSKRLPAVLEAYEPAKWLAPR